MYNDQLLRLKNEYPFTRLANLLTDVTPRANTEPMILSVGDPQHQPPPMLEETVRQHAHLWNRYPLNNGTPEFRRAVAGWLTRRYGLPEGLVEPDRMVLPVAGTKEGLFLVALMAVPEKKKGKQPVVLLPNPAYPVYEGGTALSRADLVYMDATRDTGFLPDFDAIAPELLDRTALCYLCTPSNPQGAVGDLAYLQNAIRLAREHDFVLVVDECYAEIYTGAPPPGGLEAAAGLRPINGAHPFDHVLVFHSLSKRSSAAGLRSGFVAGDPKLIAEFLRLRSFSSQGTPLPLLAAATALWEDDAHVVENRALYREKFDAAERVLDGRFGYHRPDGGFFLWLEVGDGEQAARRLWAEGGIKVLPGEYMTKPDDAGRNHGKPFIRVALVHDTATVTSALERMARIL
jgi:N-succinyldiaminopimelate aminotransferase